jgi:hypothetical protein
MDISSAGLLSVILAGASAFLSAITAYVFHRTYQNDLQYAVKLDKKAREALIEAIITHQQLANKDLENSSLSDLAKRLEDLEASGTPSARSSPQSSVSPN